MKSTEQWLVHDHTKIEYLLRHCIDDADIFDWWSLNRYFQEFVTQLKHHMAQEEEVLFPAYDAVRGPDHFQTDQLYQQHNEIVKLISDLNHHIQSENKDGLIDTVNQLGELFKEHNQQEEHLFLPFAAHLLYGDREELSEKLDTFELSADSRDWGF